MNPGAMADYSKRQASPPIQGVASLDESPLVEALYTLSEDLERSSEETAGHSLQSNGSSEYLTLWLLILVVSLALAYGASALGSPVLETPLFGLRLLGTVDDLDPAVEGSFLLVALVGWAVALSQSGNRQ